MLLFLLEVTEVERRERLIIRRRLDCPDFDLALNALVGYALRIRDHLRTLSTHMREIMAASRTRRTAKKAARTKVGSRTRTRTTAADTGPVTLTEAKALAQAKQPKLAIRAVRKSAAPPASPAAVGAERENSEKERREEFKRRIREYKATMEIMKKRGARRPRPKSAAKQRRRADFRGRIVRAAADFCRGRFVV